MKRDVPKMNAHLAFIESRNNFNRSSSFVFFKYLQAVQVLFNRSSIVSPRFQVRIHFPEALI